MASFSGEIPKDLLRVFDELEQNTEDMMSEMVLAGAEVVYNEVSKNMEKSFESTETLKEGLKLTRVYKTPSEDAINVHIGFRGYVQGSKPTKRHPQGTPIPLIALAREYGTSSGERKKPFFRKSFNKSKINGAMLIVQSKYIKGD